jgi:hypothetical protein
MLFLTREEVRFRTEDTINDHATNPSGSMRAENSITDSEHHSSIDQVLPDNGRPENAMGNNEIQTFQSTEDQSVNAESALPNSFDASHNDIDQGHMLSYDEYSESGSSEQGSEQSGSSSSSPSDTNSVRQEGGTHGQPDNLQWSREMSGSEEGEDGASEEGDEEWHVINSQEAAEPHWQSDPSFSPSTYNNWFGPPEDAVYGVELRELLSR